MRVCDHSRIGNRYILHLLIYLFILLYSFVMNGELSRIPKYDAFRLTWCEEKLRISKLAILFTRTYRLTAVCIYCK